MNKAELIDALAAKAEMTKVESKKALDALMDIAKAEMARSASLASAPSTPPRVLQERVTTREPANPSRLLPRRL